MTKNDKIQDSALWLDFKQGNKAAFAALYDRHIADLLHYGYRLTTDSALIKDSIHDLFLHLWTHRQNLGQTDSVRFYLYRSLRNRLIRNLENQGKEISVDDFSTLNTAFQLPVEALLIDKETTQEQIKNLKTALAKLPKRQQEAIQLRYYHDFSLEQIAEIMDISNQSVRNTLHRALTELRDLLGVSVGLIGIQIGIQMCEIFNIL